MPLIHFDATSQWQYPALEVYFGLKDSELRHVQVASFGVYIAESSTVVRRALAAGHEPLSFLVAERYVASVSDLIAKHDEIDVYVATDDVLTCMTGFHVHRGALAAMKRPVPQTMDEAVHGARRVVVAEGVNDHTNLGSIFRTAAALGWDAVILTPTAADPFYRRTVRVSMGAVFSMPHARVTHTVSAIKRLSALGFTTIALELTPQALSLDNERFHNSPEEPVALVLGAEGPGITRETLQTVDLHVQIPQNNGRVEHPGVESLNVSHAATIAMWQLR